MDAGQLEKMFGRTAEDLDAMAAPFEDGVWPEGRTTSVGRPRLADEKTVTVTVKMPASELRAIDEKAKARGISRSQFIRDACRSVAAIL